MEILNSKLIQIKSTIKKIQNEISSVQSKKYSSITNKYFSPLATPRNLKEKEETDISKLSDSFFNGKDHTHEYVKPIKTKYTSDCNSVINTSFSSFLNVQKGYPFNYCNKKNSPFKIQTDKIDIISPKGNISSNSNSIFSNYFDSYNKYISSKEQISKDEKLNSKMLSERINISFENTQRGSKKGNKGNVINEIGKLYNFSDNENKALSKRIKKTYKIANYTNLLIDEVMKINFKRNNWDNKPEHLIKWIKLELVKKKNYVKMISLYKRVCEKLIFISDQSDVDELNCYINDKIAYTKISDSFLNDIKNIIRAKGKNKNKKLFRNNSDFALRRNKLNINKDDSYFGNLNRNTTMERKNTINSIRRFKEFEE